MKINHSFCALISSILLFYPLMIKSEEYFTAIAELNKLLRTENSVSFGIEAYLKMEEERLRKIKWFHKHFSENHNAAKKNPEKFLSNPMNAYLLIKRLTSDWESTNGLIGNSGDSALVLKISSQGTFFPSNTDLVGAAEALMRLQEIYLLDAEVLARGEIKGTISSMNLTASDCFELGLHAYNAGKFKLSLVWMQEVLNRIDDEKEIQTGSKENALMHMAYCQHFLHNNTAAADLMEQIVKIDSDHAVAKSNVAFFRTLADLAGFQDSSQITGMYNKAKMSDEDEVLYDAYERLCRGESLKTPQEESQLYCYYTNSNNSFLLLQPIKAEVLNLKSRLVLYHDVLKDWEIDAVKELAVPRVTIQRVISNYVLFFLAILLNYFLYFILAQKNLDK